MFGGEVGSPDIAPAAKNLPGVRLSGVGIMIYNHQRGTAALIEAISLLPTSRTP